ncbi:ISAzo13 family transposase [Pseudarthrobacter sp. P1]|uniref:ISAzo13 family transposase n=1 Tax=Pseudarthrobacter sp. P1 TaxID=3418418 RepID=UPI003CF36C14
MGVTVEIEQALAAKFRVLFPHLDERQRRLLMGAEAQVLSHGGIRAVARAAGISEHTVSRGMHDLDACEAPLGRTRLPGGGRKRLSEMDAGLRPALLALVEPDERGDPMSPLRWTTKSTRILATTLTAQGHRVGADTVAGLLHQEGFSLQSNAKTLEGKQSPDRDAQFRYINDQAKAHRETGDPVLSVDAKKKELVGDYRNGGKEWRRAGDPVPVNTHDFPDEDLGKALPYGIYDMAANAGWVNVGTDHDTAAFAVESLRRWWNGMGRESYPQARRLLVTADAGGSNGYRPRAWKDGLAALATETGLSITVCHFPPGTSKWNSIEHRLFAQITMNWRGRPLVSHEVIVNTIAATTTRTGLRVHAELDTGRYPTGVAVSDQQMADLPITRHDWHGDWNYTLRPAAPEHSAHETDGEPPRPDHAWLHHPALTGIEYPAWEQLIEQLGVARHAQREAALHQRRGHARRATAGTGRKAVLTLADRTAITLLYQRFAPPQRTLAHLFGVTQQTIHRVIQQTRALLTVIGYTPEPAGLRLTTAAEIATHVANAGAVIPEQTKATG